MHIIFRYSDGTTRALYQNKATKAYLFYVPNHGHNHLAYGVANATLEFAGWIFGSQKPKRNNLNGISKGRLQSYAMITIGTNK